MLQALLAPALTLASLFTPPAPQHELSAEDWQADLRFLQQTVHAEYPFLFEKITSADFDTLVDELHVEIPTLAPHEIVAGLAQVVSAFEYGHTQLNWQGAPIALHSVPLNLYAFSDGLWVEGAHPDWADALGARVTHVEGTPTQAALAAIRPLVPAENDQFFRAYGLRYLLMPEALHAQGLTPELRETVTLTLERDGKTLEHTLATVPLTRFPTPYGFVQPGGSWSSVRADAPVPLYLRELGRIYDFVHLPEHDTLYVRQSQIQDEASEPIPEFYARVFDFVEEHEVDRLVLDVRLNGGGNNYKNKPIVTGLLKSSRIDRPGGLYVILGRRTFSACQNLVNELDTYTQAIFVGEPTAENVNFFGDTRRIELPNSRTPVSLSFAWWQDKPPWENDDWLAPDLAIEPSFEDHSTGRDPVLETILGLPLRGTVADPAERLRALVAAADFDELLSEATRLAQDPLYTHFELEPELNRSGYELLRSGDVHAAVAIMRINTNLFPQSANAWDSLGEATWRAGEVDAAVALYRQAITLDPEGPTGANARTMLGRIESER